MERVDIEFDGEKVSIEELRKLAKQAGFKLMANKKKRMSIELEESNYLKLQKEAKERKVSMNRMLNHMIEMF